MNVVSIIIVVYFVTTICECVPTTYGSSDYGFNGDSNSYNSHEEDYHHEVIKSTFYIFFFHSLIPIRTFFLRFLFLVIRNVYIKCAFNKRYVKHQLDHYNFANVVDNVTITKNIAA